MNQSQYKKLLTIQRKANALIEELNEDPESEWLASTSALDSACCALSDSAEFSRQEKKSKC